jgi:hypothetical protein
MSSANNSEVGEKEMQLQELADDSRFGIAGEENKSDEQAWTV